MNKSCPRLPTIQMAFAYSIFLPLSRDSIINDNNFIQRRLRIYTVRFPVATNSTQLYKVFI